MSDDVDRRLSELEQETRSLCERVSGLELARERSRGAAPHRRSQQRRTERQIALLPGIRDCHDCHGAVLDVAEKCQQCGNPMWKHDWLTAD